MGSGIIEVAARAGLDVIGIEISADAAKAASARVEGSLRKAEARGKIEAAEVDAVLGRIRFQTDLQTLADRDLVVEAASEDETIKLELFRTLGQVLTKDDAILASNTSSIPIVKLGAVSGRAGVWVLGLEKSNVRKNCGRFCRSIKPYTLRRVENGAVVICTDGPPMVRSSRPAAASRLSRNASKSSRRRFIRHTSWFSASAMRPSSRASLACR